jgi:hypothetical protein
MKDRTPTMSAVKVKLAMKEREDRRTGSIQAYSLPLEIFAPCLT